MNKLIIRFSPIIACIQILQAHSEAKMVFQKETKSQRLIVLADDQGQNQKVISDPQKDTYHPEISSSGRYVAYSEGVIAPPNTMMQIVVQDLQTKTKEVWTPLDNQYIHSEFSGNEKYLVFSGPNPKTKKQNIFIINLNLERLKQPTKTVKIISTKSLPYNKIKTYKPNFEIIESNYDCYAPAVSSDGSLIIYHRTQNKSDKKSPKQLVVYNSQTKQEHPITDADKHAMFPSISADDRYIAYVSQDGGLWDIYAYDLWTKTTKQLTNDPEIEFTPTFNSKGEIYFTRFSQPSRASIDQSFDIDIYFLSNTALTHSGFTAPKVFLNDSTSAEYAPSFSNSKNLLMQNLEYFPKPERSSFGSVTLNDVIYIAGGHQGPEHTYPKESFLNIFQAYNMNTKTWSTLPSMNEPKHGFQMAAYNTFIYVFGGFTFSPNHKPMWKSVDTIERYDIITGQWKTLNVKLPRPRSSNALAVVDDKVYLIGGWNSTPKFENDKEGLFHPEIDVFNLIDESVTTLTTQLSSPLRRAFTAVVYNNEIYLLGGIGQGASHFDWIDNVTVFSPLTNTWREQRPLPFATFAPGAGVIGNNIFLIGGMILRDLKNFDLDYVDDIYSYDIHKNQWQHAGVYLNQNKGFPQVVLLSNSELGILGGHTYVTTPNGIIDHPVSHFESLKTNN